MTHCMRCSKLEIELEIANKTISILNEAYDELNKKYASIVGLPQQDISNNDGIETFESLIEQVTQTEHCIQQQPEYTLVPVDSFQDLERLEADASSAEFVRVIRSNFAKQHEDLQNESGASMCYHVIDQFFSRTFLTTCSWTGAAKNRAGTEKYITKIPLAAFPNTIQLFYLIVSDVDPRFTFEKVEKFLRHCCCHAVQRSRQKRVKKSIPRAKLKKKNVQKHPVSSPQPQTQAQQINLIHQDYEIIQSDYIQQECEVSENSLIQQPCEEVQNHLILQHCEEDHNSLIHHQSEVPSNSLILHQCELDQNNLIQPHIETSDNNVIHISFSMLP
ncbi:uncharacterized protein LOC125951515 [Anopheles darlingi]|uniref:uncharacterized protein LOC125951515 n=1 Tax=Anopheles darlingi TaxID=43151 RepID=UPI002100600D|nr:uncharacterized protein LOC125951515 [Anopheles darlingi]XP_049536352.1 uncharacterized protein LOC125951515 [Anopheles darlingi]XP_049536354.1 uncharacterized protein LOC125951515 [Anopheles darlingi]